VTHAPLTVSEIERAIEALVRQRRLHRGPWEAAALNRLLGRSRRPLTSTLAGLAQLGLLRPEGDGRWRLTAIGNEVLDARTRGDWRPLARVVLRHHDLSAEVLALISAANTERDSVNVVIKRTYAGRVAPAAAAVASWPPEWRHGDHLLIPRDVLEDVMTANALDIATGRPSWVEAREAVGHRAEAYSLRWCRQQHGSAAVVHVAGDEKDFLGYDIEVVRVEPSELIECKGSRSRELTFVWSDNERRTAQDHGPRYRVHFWGSIDLRRDPADEYAKLVASGYPTVIGNPAELVTSGALAAECAVWRVRIGIADHDENNAQVSTFETDVAPSTDR
jgi:hypothetical protein